MASGVAVAGDILYESADFNAPGATSGYALGQAQYLGVRFRNISPWRVAHVGGHVFRGDEQESVLFAAIVPIDGPSGLPADIDLSDAVWSGTFDPPEVSDDATVDVNVILPPGYWGLVFGAGGLFGSAGSGGMASGQINVNNPAFFRLQDGEWLSSSTPGKRFFVYGTRTCIEDTGDGRVDCNEYCFDQVDNDADGLTDCEDDDCWHLVACCDADGDGVDRDEALCSWGGDCDDSPLTGATVFPGAGEIANDGLDQDCDGVDICYADEDRDGFGSMLVTVLSGDMTCGNEVGESATADDCDDDSPRGPTVYPGAREVVGDGIDQDCNGHDACYVDQDGDGFGARLVEDGIGLRCDLVPGLSPVSGDCDDTGPVAASRYPGAPEIAGDHIDQDCDGVDACYQDLDGDNFGSGVLVAGLGLGCGVDPGTANTPGDCMDLGPGASLVYPGAAEVPGDGVDQDCDGVDTCFRDLDGDGWGGDQLIVGSSLVCGATGDEVSLGGDCDETSPDAMQIHPGAPEIAGDGVDQDCNGSDHCYYDRDRDGFGGAVSGPGSGATCSESPGMSGRSDDCVDVGPGAQAIHPGAPEIIADGVDQDCDQQDSCWFDQDRDGFGGEQVIGGVDLRCNNAPNESVRSGDCDDQDPAVRPNVREIIGDQIDQDCDGVDACYQDLDGDGFGISLVVLAGPSGCVGTPFMASRDGDCDDADQTAYPGAWEVAYDGVDQDCDGLDHRDIDQDGQEWVGAGGTDCDDHRRTVYQGAPEQPNGIDDDCDGVVDEGTLAHDDDGDGLSERAGDCDDTRVDVRPGATEVCDGLDQDCDGRVDEETPCSDDDYDGYTELDGDCNDSDSDVHPGLAEVWGNGIDDDCDGVLRGEIRDDDGDGYTSEGGDCEPLRSSVYPGAPEQADGLDNDCDGIVDEGTYVFDDDGDGYAETEGDCHDGDPLIHPGAPERPNFRDDDCDGFGDVLGIADDQDGDGYGYELDCDDLDPTTHVFAREIPDGVDNDCNGLIDDGLADVDGDGWTIAQGDCNDWSGWARPDLDEVCDAIDNDCDGLVDEGCDPVVYVPIEPSGGCQSTGHRALGWLGLVALGLHRRRRVDVVARVGCS